MSTTTNPDRELLAAVMLRQQELNLDNRSMAQRVGVSEGMWSLLTHGKRRIGLRTARAIIRAFPDLTAHGVFYLQSDLRQSNTDLPQRPEEHAR